MDEFLAWLSHSPLAILLPLLWLALLPLAVKGYRRLRQAVLRWGIIGGEVAFTLLVIVVVGHTGCAMKKAKQAQCINNLRALGAALFLYMEDWDARLPPASHWGDAIAESYLPKAIVHRSEFGRYTPLPERAFRCPSARSPFGYAFNVMLDKMPISQIALPAETVMLLESDAQNRNAFSGQSSLPSKPRHLGGDIYGFADGHVKWVQRGFAALLHWQP